MNQSLFLFMLHVWSMCAFWIYLFSLLIRGNCSTFAFDLRLFQEPSRRIIRSRCSVTCVAHVLHSIWFRRKHNLPSDYKFCSFFSTVFIHTFQLPTSTAPDWIFRIKLKRARVCYCYFKFFLVFFKENNVLLASL